MSYLIKKGQAQAMKEIHQEEIAYKKEREKLHKEQMLAKSLAIKISKEMESRHQLKYLQAIPQKVEIPYYRSKSVPIINEMIRDGIKAEDIRMSAEYLSFQKSNKVLGKLKSFKG